MKDKTTAGLLALFFGNIGVHRFYLGQTGLGILHLVFCWTFIPWLVGIVNGIVLLSMDREDFDIKYNWKYLQRRQYVRQPNIVINNHTGPGPTSAPRPVAEPTPTKSGPKRDPFHLSGDQKFEDYDFDGAITDYRRSLNVNPRQAEVHFNLARLYSIHEQTGKSLLHLSKAIEHGYYDFDAIDQHDHLAYLRSTPDFVAFKTNGYRLPDRILTASSPAPAPSPAEETLELSDDLITRIERLARLKEDGILNEESFAREKEKVLRQG